MRLAIISDIHANLEALRATLLSISAQGADRILCLGDIVGYNANPAECIALLREFDPICVAGNHDRAVAGRITTEGFSATAIRAVAWTRGQLSADALAFLAGLPLQVSVQDHVVAVHGALLPGGGCDMTWLDTDERRRSSFEALSAHPSGARVCAFGHTHHLEIFELRDGAVLAHAEDPVQLRAGPYYLVNPGTVGQPRTADHRASYLVLDTAQRTLLPQRVEYDFSASVAKTRKAGLAPRSSAPSAPVRAALKWSLRNLGLYGSVERIVNSHRRRDGR